MTEQTNNTKHHSPQENFYLLFTLGNEIYAVKLVDIREVTEPQICRPLPNTMPSFVGICNLRGQIVGLLDLRIHFGIATHPSAGIPMIFESEFGALGAIMDKIVAVEFIKEEQIVKNASLKAIIPDRYIVGTIKYKEQLVIVIDVKSILSQEELSSISGLKNSLNAA